MSGTDDRRLVGGLALGALAMRLMQWSGTFTIGTDSAAFLRMAELIREGSWHAALTTHYHPGYPAVVAFASPLTGGVESAGFIVSILFGSLSIVPLFLLARDAFGKPVAIVAAILYATHGYIVELHADVMTEGVYLAALFSAIWMGRRFLDSRRLAWAVGAGAASGAAYLVRHEGLIAVAGLVCWFVVEGIRRRREGAAGDCFLGAIFVAGSFLVLAMPFLVWVRGEMGRWATTAKGSGIPFRRLLEGDVVTPQADLFVRALHAFKRLHYVLLLVPLAVGLARAWREERGRRLYLVSWSVAYAAGVGYTMLGMGYVSDRYFVPVAALLLPFTSFGLLRMMEGIREPLRARVAVATTLLLAAFLGYKALDWNRREDAPLVRAGVWIREHSKGRARIMTTRDKVVWYARGDVRPPPKVVSDAIGADFVVVSKRDLENRRWACLHDLAGDPRFERIPSDFTTVGKGEDPVVIFRVRP